MSNCDGTPPAARKGFPGAGCRGRPDVVAVRSSSNRSVAALGFPALDAAGGAADTTGSMVSHSVQPVSGSGHSAVERLRRRYIAPIPATSAPKRTRQNTAGSMLSTPRKRYAHPRPQKRFTKRQYFETGAQFAHERAAMTAPATSRPAPRKKERGPEGPVTLAHAAAVGGGV